MANPLSGSGGAVPIKTLAVGVDGEICQIAGGGADAGGQGRDIAARGPTMQRR